MNLKLEQEIKNIENTAWYRITVDDKYITGSYDKEAMEQLFQRIKSDPKILENGQIILQSEEI